MEMAVIVLAVAVAVLALAVLRRGGATPQRDRDLALKTEPEVSAGVRGELEVVRRDQFYELLLAEQPLMRLQPSRYEDLPERTPLTGTYAQWIGTLLDNPRVIEFIGGQRWVIAKVPDVIRHGGSWMKAADGSTKAVARAAEKGQFAAIAELVGGGAALGAAAALGPAVIGAVASAYAYHRIEAALRNVDAQLSLIDRRLRDSDMGVITGARRLVEEMAEWGPPHLWPQQLRFELAVRRAALDPVCFAEEREVERLIAAMANNNEKFVGLDKERRKQLSSETQVLLRATMVKAQLDYTTTMLLLDSESAPFGLERLAQTEQGFADDVSRLRTSLATAIEGKRPTIITPRGYRRSRATAPAVEGVLGKILDLTESLTDGSDTTLILSVSDRGTLDVAMPSVALTPALEQPDPDAGA
jgi:hypothetical protein